MINRRLYDILLRHQIYVDGYKAYLVSQWKELLPRLVINIKAEFARSNFKTIDEMTKKEFYNFKSGVQFAVLATFNYWQNLLLKSLKDFEKAEVKMQKAILANYLIEQYNETNQIIFDENRINQILEKNQKFNKTQLLPFAWLLLDNDEKIFNKISDSMMGAFGKTVNETINELGINVSNKILTEINKGIANNQTLDQTLTDIIGTPSNKFKDGLLPAIDRESINVTETSIQHFAITIETAFTSSAFEKYIWVGILDIRICPNCLFFNGKIYYYGAGPNSPYHRKCRCSMIPYTGSKLPDETSVTQWEMQQPDSVKQDLQASKSIPLNIFETKLSNILT
jgi:hypothetical protein